MFKTSSWMKMLNNWGENMFELDLKLLCGVCARSLPPPTPYWSSYYVMVLFNLQGRNQVSFCDITTPSIL